MEKGTLEKLLNALSSMDSDNEEHYTAGGLPKIDVLEQISGVDGVTASMRDQAFDAYQNENSGAVGAPTEKPKMYKVTIMETEGEANEAFLNVNGDTRLVQRNEEVLLEEKFVECLKNSKVESQYKDPETLEVKKISIARFPFQAVPA